MRDMILTGPSTGRCTRASTTTTFPEHTMLSALARIALGAAALVATTAGAVPATAAPASSCSDLDVVFARATYDIPYVGVAGAWHLAAVRSALRGVTISSYGVRYPALVNPSGTGLGADDLVRHLRSTATACPGTKFVLGGYSQGATVVSIALGVRTRLGAGATVPTSLRSRIVAVTTFGNPIGGAGQSIGTSSPVYAERTREFCTPADVVCRGLVVSPGLGHTGYFYNGDFERAGRFVAGRYNRA
ncbi:cutinase family protein [Amycolatopsis sp. NPDC088138]|uniref:cutinase family protein n=1 Tax=Amycolatopsis sp. NPDC088138 TaxID=3363938 RepID=UPI0038246F28